MKDTEALAFGSFFFLMFSTYVCAISSRKLFLIDDYSQSHQLMVMDENLADELLLGASLLGILFQLLVMFKYVACLTRTTDDKGKLTFCLSPLDDYWFLRAFAFLIFYGCLTISLFMLIHVEPRKNNIYSAPCAGRLFNLTCITEKETVMSNGTINLLLRCTC